MTKKRVVPDAEPDAVIVLRYLRRFGQLLDAEIAGGTGVSMPDLQRALDELAASGEISRCKVIRYENGKSIEGIQCRISGYAPPPAPGRKSGTPSSGS